MQSFLHPFGQWVPFQIAGTMLTDQDLDTPAHNIIWLIVWRMACSRQHRSRAIHQFEFPVFIRLSLSARDLGLVFFEGTNSHCFGLLFFSARRLTKTTIQCHAIRQLLPKHVFRHCHEQLLLRTIHHLAHNNHQLSRDVCFEFLLLARFLGCTRLPFRRR